MVKSSMAKVARKVGLRYATDSRPGISRKLKGQTASYRTPSGRAIRDRKTLARIRSLAIPPAWSNVWISIDPNSHLQATGRDAKGRKQYRYHPDWRAKREEAKFHHVIAFAKAIPQIRRRVKLDLKKRGLPKAKVLAAVVHLLESSLIRVGNDEYARQNGSYGLTTLRDRHADVQGSRVRFRFRGKSGIRREVELHSRQLASIVRKCQELPGQELFQYQDDQGRACDIGSADVNEYLRAISGLDITAKDFRTWAGTTLAAQALREFETFDSHARAKRNVVRAIERVAARLGNTPSVCRKCYIHPAIIDAYLDRSLARVIEQRAESELRRGLRAYSPEEAATLLILRQRAQQVAS